MANIVMGKGKYVVDELQSVIHRVSVSKPLYTYEADTFVGDFVVGVEVMQDSIVLGYISYAHSGGRRSSDGSRTDAFVIESPNIIYSDRRRGHVKRTCRVSEAVRIVLKYFAPPTLECVCTSALNTCRDTLKDRQYSWGKIPRDIVSLDTGALSTYFIQRRLSGEEVPMPEGVAIINENLLHKYGEYLAYVQIQEVFRFGDPRRGHVAWELRDGSIYVVPAAYMQDISYSGNVSRGYELLRYRKYEDMPLDLQRKIGVLKIASPCDPILDVGIKFREADNLMYVYS